MEKFIGRRVVQEFLGTSAIDDVNIKTLLREYTSRLDALIKEEDPAQCRYHQGYIAALDTVIRTMRENQKKQIASDNEEGD